MAGIICVGVSETLQAASKPVSVTSCKLNAAGSKLTVKAKVSRKTSAMGKKLYLHGIDGNVSESKTLTGLGRVSMY